MLAAINNGHSSRHLASVKQSFLCAISPHFTPLLKTCYFKAKGVADQICPPVHIRTSLLCFYWTDVGDL